MSIVLTGYRGSGKTTVGRKLAEALGWPFVDLDSWITERAGKTIAEIFKQDGEPAFRDLESEAIAELARLNEHVIALGGGTLMREDNRAAILQHNHSIIYLRCQSAELLRRITADYATHANRPSLTNLNNGLAEIKTLLSEREPIYRTIMTHEMDVTSLTEDQVVAEIMRML